VSDIGHNSGAVAADELRLLIERVEKINEDIKEQQLDRKDVFLEAKSRGYDVKTMRFAIKQRAMDKDRRDEQRALEETYLAALGLL
jgi:uncharacterized protein (UPF0335 family)